MKPFLLLLTTAALLAPVAAQDQAPGTDLLDLFDMSQRESATDTELMKMLENKALMKEVMPPQPPRWLVGLVVKPLAPEIRAHFDLPEGAGVIVESLMHDGPAAQAGIKQNDIVVTANERGISSLEELKEVVEKAGSDGKAVHLEVIQRGKRSVVKVTPRGPDAPAASAKKEGKMSSNRPLIEIQRRLEAQQQEIDKLRREVQQLQERINRE